MQIDGLLRLGVQMTVEHFRYILRLGIAVPSILMNMMRVAPHRKPFHFVLAFVTEVRR
jgi:hypothetical protein